MRLPMLPGTSIRGYSLSLLFLVLVRCSIADQPAGTADSVSLEVVTAEGRRAWLTNDVSDWSLVCDDGADGAIALETDSPLNERNPRSLRLTVRKPGKRCGVANDASGAIHVQAGDWYDLKFHARTEKRENNRGYGLTVSLESHDARTVCARTTIPEVGGEWADYTVALAVHHSHPNARLVITMSEAGTIWLAEIVLVRRPVTPHPDPGTEPSQ